MPDISVINFQRKFIIPTSMIIKTAARCYKALNLCHEAVTVVCAGTMRMRAMNKKFLGHDYVTDVITFDSGDIVICPAVASYSARIHRHSIEQEMILYVVHGLLHLGGYRDKDPADIRIMRSMEAKLIGGI